MTRHLRSIRYPGGNDRERGSDPLHQVDDPLWQTDQVQAILMRGPKRTESEEREIRSRHNQRYYQKKMLARKQRQQELETKVISGELTSSQARNELHGYFHLEDC